MESKRASASVREAGREGESGLRSGVGGLARSLLWAAGLGPSRGKGAVTARAGIPHGGLLAPARVQHSGHGLELLRRNNNSNNNKMDVLKARR